MLAEGRAERRAGDLLPVEGVLDRALVDGQPVGDRDRDRPQVAGELGGREEPLAVPVDIEGLKVDLVADEEGVDPQEQVAADLVGPQCARRLAREEQDRAQVLEGAGAGLLLEHLAGALEALLELGEDLLTRGGGLLGQGGLSLFRYRELRQRVKKVQESRCFVKTVSVATDVSRHHRA